MSRWARPARPWAPIAGALLIIGLWWLVAHNAGSGWVQVLGDLVFGALLIGIVGPFVVVTRARVTIAGAPGDGVAGFPVPVTVVSNSRVRVRPVTPPGPESFVGPRGRRGPVDEAVTLLPVRRGIHDMGRARRCVGRTVRVAVVDEARPAPPAVCAPRVAPLRPGAARAPTARRGDR